MRTCISIALFTWLCKGCSELAQLRHGSDIDYHYRDNVCGPTSATPPNLAMAVETQTDRAMVRWSEDKWESVRRACRDNIQILSFFGQLYVEHRHHDNPMYHFVATDALMALTQMLFEEGGGFNGRMVRWMAVINLIGLAAASEIVPIRPAQILTTCMALCVYATFRAESNISTAVLLVGALILHENLWILAILVLLRAFCDIFRDNNNQSQ